MMRISLARQLACVERELAKRQHIYPSLVAEQKMLPVDAEKELIEMEAVVATISDFVSDFAGMDDDDDGFDSY